MSQSKELEHEVSELRQKWATAEQTFATLDQIIYLFLHNLRSSTTTMRGVTDILIAKGDSMKPAQREDSYQMLQNQAIFLDDLVEDVFLLMRLHLGQHRYPPKPCRVHDLADSWVLITAKWAKQKNLRVINTVPDDIQVKIYEYLLSFIFKQLITNSIKFTEAGGEIVIGAKAKKDQVELYISDTGVGIPADRIDSIFEFDLDEWGQNSTPGTDDEVGVGIGLFLCQSFIELNQGSIWIESEPGLGTTVRFTLPKA